MSSLWLMVQLCQLQMIGEDSQGRLWFFFFFLIADFFIYLFLFYVHLCFAMDVRSLELEL